MRLHANCTTTTQLIFHICDGRRCDAAALPCVFDLDFATRDTFPKTPPFPGRSRCVAVLVVRPLLHSRSRCDRRQTEPRVDAQLHVLSLRRVTC
jgi:hypothetical protein